MAGVHIDVTERERAEAALEESRARYRALYDDNPSMYFTLDAAGTVLSVNEFGAQQLGYPPAELVGQSVLKMIHEGDREEARQWLASCAENAGTIATTEMRKVRRDGSTMWVSEVARAVQGFGGQALIVVCEDITERKKAELALAEREAQLGLAGKAARVSSFIIDYATGRIQTSPGFAAIHGLAEENDELTCEEWRARMLPDDLARFEALRTEFLPSDAASLTSSIALSAQTARRSGSNPAASFPTTATDAQRAWSASTLISRSESGQRNSNADWLPSWTIALERARDRPGSCRPHDASEQFNEALRGCARRPHSINGVNT